MRNLSALSRRVFLYTTSLVHPILNGVISSIAIPSVTFWPANLPRFVGISCFLVDRVTAEPKPETRKVLVSVMGPLEFIHSLGISLIPENPRPSSVIDPTMIVFLNAWDTHAITFDDLPANSIPKFINPEHSNACFWAQWTYNLHRAKEFL